MTIKPRREQYRVTITRPEGVKVEQIRQWIHVGLRANSDHLDAKVELMRERPAPWWRRLLGG